MTESYLAEIRLLESSVDIENAQLCFENTFEVIRQFISDVISNASELNRLSIGSEARMRASYYLEKSMEFDSIPEGERKDIARQAWSDTRVFTERDSRLISLVMCCLWEKGDYLHDVDTCMQDNYFATVLISAYQLDPKLGRAFREFVEQHPLMQRYRF
jgi:hypothetical protein